MRPAHQRSWQRRGVPALLAVFAACQDTSLPPSIWPPQDFELVVEEVQLADGAPRTVRRLRVVASGLVVYGTSSRSRVDRQTGTALPVFDRLCAYELVPTCVRALSRRLDRLGIARLETVQGERGGSFATSLRMSWRAFGETRVVRAAGRVSGPMAEILAVVTGHMPEGERFGLPGLDERPVTYVLRGVPAPRPDVRGALAAHRELLEDTPQDEALLLQAFALACEAEDRGAAEQLLGTWSEVTEVARRQAEQFPEGEQLTPAVLRAMLPGG